MDDPQLTEPELADLEAAVQIALRDRDNAGLNVIGYGEMSIVLGYPFDAPRYACKPSFPYTRQELDAYVQMIDDYVAALRARGLSVAPTQLMEIERGDRFVAYQVQPLFPSETIGDNVLRAAEPDPEHPLLVSLASMMNLVTDRVSFDSQMTNWSWDGETPTLVDVGTPFFWHEDGELVIDLKPLVRAIPAPLRRFVLNDVAPLLARYQVPRNVAIDIVAQLMRIELDEWIEPTITALNAELDQPIDEAEGRASLADDHKSLPRLKRLQKIERTWSTWIRRRSYDYFIQPTSY
ncbi:MAG: hypothetical protein GY708_30490 [Actinomycetia bacterium]|nr:hypothetical protein [Actinomycetes bacterium]